jgi:hypothetical protein
MIGSQGCGASRPEYVEYGVRGGMIGSEGCGASRPEYVEHGVRGGLIGRAAARAGAGEARLDEAAVPNEEERP